MKLDPTGTGRARRGRLALLANNSKGNVSMKPYLTLLATTVALVLGASAVASAGDVFPPLPSTPHTQSAPAAQHGYLVVTVAFAEGSTTPANTPDETALSIAQTLRNEVNPWFAAVSQGLYAGEPVDFYAPVITVTTTEPLCSGPWGAEVERQSDNALRAQGVEPDDFKTVFYYHRSFPACHSYAFGTHRVGLNGQTGLSALVHEIGHTLGLGHGNSMVCWNAAGAFVPLPGLDDGTCSHVEYGDIYSGMGPSGTTYASAQLELLGWNTGRVVRTSSATPTTTMFLTPIEFDVSGTIEALRIDDGVALWLEYRTPTGVDSSSSFRGGLLVRAEQTGVQAPLLLNMQPERSSNPFFQFVNPEMRVGQTWRNPRGNLSITLNSAGPLGASVTISQTPHRAPNIDGLTPSAARGTITAAGYLVGTTTSIVDCERIGTVISQNPLQGTPLLPGRVVNFTFGVPPVRGCGGTPQ